MDLPKGNFRAAQELSLVGNKVYLMGGEVINFHNCTDEVLIGTIRES
jgi:hypothetical protein